MMYIQTAKPNPKAYRLLRHCLTFWGRVNSDGTGIAIERDGELFLAKSQEEAKLYFHKLQIPLAQRIAGHVRASTSGSIADKNAHPFVSCDGKYVLMHNGILSGWLSIKSELEKRGHKFQSETDSEVVVHILEETGIDGLLPKLKELDLRGSMNLLIMTADETYGYSDGSLELLKGGKYGLLGFASDTDPIDSMRIKKVHLQSGTLARITKDGQVHTKNVGTIPGGAVYYVIRDGHEYEYENEYWGGCGGGRVVKRECATGAGKYDGLDTFGSESGESIDSGARAGFKTGAQIDQELRETELERVYREEKELEEAFDRAYVQMEREKRRKDWGGTAKVASDIETKDGRVIAAVSWGEPGDMYCPLCNILWAPGSLVTDGRCGDCFGELIPWNPQSIRKATRVSSPPSEIELEVKTLGELAAENPEAAEEILALLSDDPRSESKPKLKDK